MLAISNRIATRSSAHGKSPPPLNWKTATRPARLASGRVIDTLREAILAGRLSPGSRVRQEELAEEFGISRIPVREALRRLEAEGLVVLVPNSGAWVAKLDRAECVEIYRIREQIEPLAILDKLPEPQRADAGRAGRSRRADRGRARAPTVF